MEACYGRADHGGGSCGTPFPRTVGVNAGICQSCSTLTRTAPTNVRRGICKGKRLAADKDFPWAIGSTGAPSLPIMVVFAVDISCCGQMYHINTDISWRMKLRYSYPPGQQHGTTDLVPFGSVILWILIKICYGRIFSDHCHTRPPTFSVVLSLVQECLLRTFIPGPHHTKGPLTPFYFSSATIDPGTFATDTCYTIMLARTGLPDPYY